MTADLDNKMLARQWNLEVQDGSDWHDIEGVVSVEWSGSTEEVDVTDWDSGGFMERFAAQRSAEVTVTGYHVEDPATAARDPGQQRLEALAGQVGNTTGVGMFRVQHPLATHMESFSGYVDGPFWKTGMGGGLNDPNAWECTIMLTGTITSTTP